MKRDNRGLTIAELIVTLALLGILAALLGASVSTAFSAKEKSGAASIDAYLSLCRTRSLSRGGAPYIILGRDGESGEVWGEYYEGGVKLEKESLADKGVPVSYSVGSDEPDGALSLNGAPLKIAFSGSTGALETPGENLWIYVGKYKIKIYALTGAHRFE